MKAITLKHQAAGLCLAGIFLGCQEPSTSPAQTGPGVTPNGGAIEVERAFNKQGIVKQGCLFGTPISFEEIDGKAVFEGDIILDPKQLGCGDAAAKASGAARSAIEVRWPIGRVNYSIDPMLPNTARVSDAIAHWAAKTKLKFTLRTNEPNFILFTPGDGCSSNLGMIGRMQVITLADGCSTGSTIHEIGHAIGLFHEQSRHTRDNDVTINWENIQDGRSNAFNSYTARGIPGFDNSTFDFGSIMLYDSYAFSRNGKPTIVKKDGSTFTSQRTALSTGDLSIAKFLYPGGWNKRPGSSARDIGIGNNGAVWIIGNQPVGSAGDFNILKWTGSAWSQVTGGGVKIDVDPAGNPWIVNSVGNIYAWNGSSFQQKPGKALDIGIGANGAVHIITKSLASANDYKIARWNGSSFVNLANGGGRTISVDANGNPWVINSAKDLWRWSETGFSPLGVKANDIGFDPDGSAYIVSNTEILGTNDYFIDRLNGNTWIRQEGGGTRIDGAPNGGAWVTNSLLDAYQR